MIELFGINEFEKFLLAIYLIAHGFIHWIFFLYKLDEKSGHYVGWSRESWLIEKVASKSLTKNIGFLTWIIVIGLFILSGLALFDIPVIDDLFKPLVLIASLVGAIAFIVYFNGLSPTPYHWILGLLIDVVLIIFVFFFPEDLVLVLAILILIFLWGMIFHSKFVKSFTGIEANL